MLVLISVLLKFLILKGILTVSPLLNVTLLNHIMQNFFTYTPTRKSDNKNHTYCTVAFNSKKLISYSIWVRLLKFNFMKNLAP